MLRHADCGAGDVRKGSRRERDCPNSNCGRTRRPSRCRRGQLSGEGALLTGLTKSVVETAWLLIKTMPSCGDLPAAWARLGSAGGRWKVSALASAPACRGGGDGEVAREPRRGEP